jgi:hypothetical protein
MSEYDASGLELVFQRANALKKKYAGRDFRASQVRNVREGNFDNIAPGVFSDEWPRPTVANLIDTMSRDFAASLAPLPTFSCSSTSMISERARNFADTRTKIANNYIQNSNLQAQNQDGADGFNCYGIYAVSVTPDFKDMLPRIRVLDGATVYPLWDNAMRTVACLQRQYMDAPDVEARWPKVREQRDNHRGLCTNERYEVNTWVDDKHVVVYLPAANNMILEYSPNLLGKCFIHAGPRPSGEGSWSGNVHGAYDDLIWPQLARHTFQMLAMEGVSKSIRAPLVVPMDVADLPEGPDAVIRSNNPQGVGRVNVAFPDAGFKAMEWLERDMQLGGMTTASRMGQQSTGWTTGRGLETLADSFSGQLASAQDMVRYILKQAVETCFEWDEKLWPNQDKKIRGQDNGVPFETTYRPSRDIKGDYTVDVTYGFAVGLDANRAVVYLLQLLGSGLVSKDYVARNLPAAVNATEELKKVDLEQLRASILAALAGLAQTIPAMAAQGADPSESVRKLAEAAALMQKGGTIEDVVAKVFAPPPPQPEQAPPGPEQGMPPEAGGMPMPAAEDGGRPSLQMLMAGLNSSGNPQMSASVSRMPAAVQ